MDPESSFSIKKTGDGSPTLVSAKYNAEYHSAHGALTESKHIFIEAGFRHLISSEYCNNIKVLECGFGTGLNAWLTSVFCQNGPSVSYVGIELHPLPEEVLNSFGSLLFGENEGKDAQLYYDIHRANWDQWVRLHPNFRILKQKRDLMEFQPMDSYDLVYYDAFGPESQPQLWTEKMFQSLFNSLQPKGILVTFCVQGAFRRMLTKVGFEWEKLPGPPGKREMLRARKPAL